MKRPLVVLAAGYVLGEVLALQDNTAVDLGILAWLCAAAAGILWLLDTWRGVLRPSAPKEKMQGRSNRKHRVLLLFWYVSCLVRLWEWQEDGRKRDFWTMRSPWPGPWPAPGYW